jgi:2',3'-cyclic-nucleotide 2'-phosphodiesterase (5'-nucleotidase family)
MLRSARLFILLLVQTATMAFGAKPEAIVVLTGDVHSAYEKTAQFVARVDALQRENPGVPLAVLINGDSLEYGNAVARRTAGTIDFAQFRALAKRAPLVINLGNHEPEFHDVPETVDRLRAAGAQVVGNLRDKSTGQLFAPASLRLTLGAHTLTIVGVTTDRLNTYRVAIRPQLDLADPAVWAREKFPELLRGAALPVVLSHAGLKADRGIFEHVPDGALFAGAHDHLRFVHAIGRTVYVHSGSWLEAVSVARLERASGGELRWRVEQQPLLATDPADPELAKLIRETLAQQLTAEEATIVGRSPRALAPPEAARFAVEAARFAASADAALVGGTTFGAGLPAGDVTRFAFDACVRFDGPLFTAEVDGAWLATLAARANQGPETPFAARAGENLVLAGPAAIDPARRYRFVTTDWIAKNAANYLGANPPALTELPAVRLKAAVIAALQEKAR